MKQITFIALIAAGESLIGAGSVLAYSGKGHGARPSFEMLDADGNGEVTQEEMQSLRAREFTASDTDGDGNLSVEELAAKRAQRAETRIQRMVEKFDADGDGALSLAEMPGPKDPTKRFDRLDSDGNGAISQEEFESARKERGGRSKKHCKDKAGAHD